MNKIILIGNLTADPDFAITPVGQVPVCRFSLAVPRRFKQQDGTDVDFIQIVAWRKVAELCRDYLAKGRKAGIVGTLQTRSWVNNEGMTVYATEVIADEVEFLSSKKDSEELEPTPAAAPKQQSRSQASNSVLNPSTPKPTAVEQQWLNDDDSDMDLPF